MNKILEKIITKKKEDLREKKKQLSLAGLREQVKEREGSGLFYREITQAINDPAVIAEVKFASPSAGDMGTAKDLLKRVKEYESAGADAISIITEPHFFKGSIDFVGKVKEAVSLPVLQKDFVIDEYQIYEAKKAGADALLLIARLVDGDMLRRFVSLTKQLGIEPVVEINEEKDLEKAVTSGTNIIAVNARDFETFHVDVSIACQLMRKIPDTFIKLGFSGIQSAVEVRDYKNASARGVLVGTSLMRSKHIEEFIAILTDL